MPIRCITFDLDNTLWDCDSVIARAERKLFEWLQAQLPRITEVHDEGSLVAHRRDFAQGNADIAFDLTLLRRRWLGAIAEEFGYSGESTEAGFQLFWERRNAVRIYAGVPDLLKRLGERYTIGAITNGNADVHYIGIGHLFDFVLSSADAGAAKPAAQIFHAARDLSGHSHEEILHVGDDPMRDVLGAGAVGMRTVWINPLSTPWPGGQVPDLVIKDVLALETRLTSLCLAR